jgi:hypothetical protein
LPAVGDRVTAPTDRATGSDAEAERSGGTGDPPAGTDTLTGADPRAEASPGRPPSWWWRFGFPAVLVVAVLAVPVLVWTGAQIVLGSSEGEIVRAVTDPALPGWEAIVEPTPVLALASVDTDGTLDSVTVLSLTGDNSGAVVNIPAGTTLGVPGIGSIPLGVIYAEAADSPLETLRASLEAMLGVGIPEIDLIEPEEWASLVGPVAPLAINNPDPVVASDSGEILFPKAAIDLPASEVWSYISTRNPGESDLNRMIRIEEFWRAWLARVAADPDGEATVPGEIESGLGLFIRRLAKGQAEIRTLPVTGEAIDGRPDAAFRPEPDEVRALVELVVPFPAGPEGSRVRVTVLDGTGELDHGVAAAVLLAAAGGQIDKVGNASTFEVSTTQITYYDDAIRSRVEALRDALGIGEIVRSDELNSATDVVVVLGEDYARAGAATPVNPGG